MFPVHTAWAEATEAVYKQVAPGLRPVPFAAGVCSGSPCGLAHRWSDLPHARAAGDSRAALSPAGEKRPLAWRGPGAHSAGRALCGAPFPEAPNRSRSPGVSVSCLWFLILRTLLPSFGNNVLFLTLSLLSGKTVGEAADVSLGYMKSKVKGEGGVIVVSNAGDWAAKWTTESMPWAAAQDGKVHFGLHRDETRTFSLP